MEWYKHRCSEIEKGQETWEQWWGWVKQPPARAVAAPAVSTPTGSSSPAPGRNASFAGFKAGIEALDG